MDSTAWHHQEIALWLIAVALVVLTVLAVWRPRRRESGDDDPERILERRYARGEIDEKTYEQMCEVLRRGRNICAS